MSGEYQAVPRDEDDEAPRKVVARDQDGDDGPLDFKDISTQQWLALLVAFLGWMLDLFDASLFMLVQTPALEELLGVKDKDVVSGKAGQIIAVFLVGAAVGGIGIGVMCDMFGRARMMVVTILLYSLGTAACALCQTWWQLMLLRFVAGVGTGGEWACGASLVAEVWPDRYRTVVAPMLHSGAGVGYLVAGLVYHFVGPYGWRVVFLCGLVPALISLAMRLFVDESEMWVASGHNQSFLSRLRAIFSAEHRSDTLSLATVVLVLTVVYWSTSAWVPSIVRDVMRDFHPDDTNEEQAITTATVVMNIGSVLGALSWIWSANALGRKVAMAAMISLQMLVVPFAFRFVTSIHWLYAFLPFVGFFVAGPHGGLAIYLPELYPTAIRGTGSAFTFNAGRLFAAMGPLVMGGLVGVTGNYYYAASVMPLVSVVLLIALLFARETRGVRLGSLDARD